MVQLSSARVEADANLCIECQVWKLCFSDMATISHCKLGLTIYADADEDAGDDCDVKTDGDDDDGDNDEDGGDGDDDDMC